MVSENDQTNLPPDEANPRRRRPRYSGTHPRKFSQKYKELHPQSFPGIYHHVAAQGRTPAGTHTPVLLAEVMNTLNPQAGNVVADCTLGYGGHAQEFLRRIGPTGGFVGLDVDASQLARTRNRFQGLFQQRPADDALSLQKPALVYLAHSHFAGLGKVMTEAGLSRFDIVLADLGVSSMQIDDPDRGFSYKYDGPLDMRMDTRSSQTAMDVIAGISASELTAALKNLADEPDAQSIADAIVHRRAFQPVARTQQLVDLVLKVKGLTRRQWRNRPQSQRLLQHPAARTFQALRMLVNDELGGLAQFLRIVPYCLRPGARVGVISFHSKEDEMVDEAFRKGRSEGVFKEISDTPIRPDMNEVAANPRSRSALFRWARAF